MNTEDQQERFLRRWEGFAERVRRELVTSGLTAEVDYIFHPPRALHPAIVIELITVDQLTPDVLLACDRAVRDYSDWSAIVAVMAYDKVVPLVQTNGGMFTLIHGGPEINRVIFDAVNKRGDGWLKYVTPPES